MIVGNLMIVSSVAVFRKSRNTDLTKGSQQYSLTVFRSTPIGITMLCRKVQGICMDVSCRFSVILISGMLRPDSGRRDDMQQARLVHATSVPLFDYCLKQPASTIPSMQMYSSN